MRRSVARTLCRLAQASESLASQATRPAAIGLLGAVQGSAKVGARARATAAAAAASCRRRHKLPPPRLPHAPQASAAVPVRCISTSAPSFAAETEYSNAVFYPEPEVEVGEAAPSFSLPGALQQAAAARPLLPVVAQRSSLPVPAPGCGRVLRRNVLGCPVGVQADGSTACLPVCEPSLTLLCTSVPAAIVDGEVKQVGFSGFPGSVRSQDRASGVVGCATWPPSPAPTSEAEAVHIHPSNAVLSSPVCAQVSLDDYKGKYVILFFYPKDFT